MSFRVRVRVRLMGFNLDVKGRGGCYNGAIITQLADSASFDMSLRQGC